MANTLANITAHLIPAIDRALKLAIELVDDPIYHNLHFMMAYQMGWVGDDLSTDAGGKRIRPLLMLLTSNAAGGSWQDTLPAAASVELLHNFSLIHDDIEDNSPMRRGRPTLWKRWGIPQAINTGDTMFTLAYLSVLRIKQTTNPEIALEASSILQRTCLHLTQGQFLDLSYESRLDLCVEDYWPMIAGKTAALIGACCEIGALAAGAGQKTQSHYREFGTSLGLAFQVQDDLLGIWGDAEITGKSVESDLSAGKKSLPVLYGLDQKADFASRWQSGPIASEEVPKLAALLEREGARSYTKERAGYYTKRALEELDKAQPTGDYALALRELAEQLLYRHK